MNSGERREREEQPATPPNKVEQRISLMELLSIISLTGFVYGPLDQRLGIKDALQKALKKPVPEHVNWTFCFGGITFLLFLLQAVTGVLLLMYYRPTTAEAYNSVVQITNGVPFGWLVRGAHHWGANLMTITVLLHMMRVYFYGAYKPPRDFNWVVGVALLMLTFTFGFSGYLLPWNQISYWATTVGTSIPEAVPVIGKTLAMLVRGGEDVTQVTLTRFFAVHIVILPAAMIAFLLAHFMIIRRQGISEAL